MYNHRRIHRKKDTQLGEFLLTLGDCFPSTPSRSKSLPPIAYGFHGPPELETKRKRQDFLIKPKYNNTLPDIPCDPKHIVLPASPKDFELTGRELNVIYTQFTDDYCGGKLNLVGSCLSKKSSPRPNDEELHPVDKFLLEDEHVKEKQDQMKRSLAHKKKVTWLRRPEYMTHTSKFSRPSGEKLEFRVHNAINKKLKGDAALDLGDLCDRATRIKGIEDTFKEAGSTIFKHPSKPNVFAEEVIPVFPDFDIADGLFVEIVFDASPSDCANIGKISEDQMNEALIKVLELDYEEEDDVERVGYFVPKHGSEGDSNASEKEYLLARDYIYKLGPTKNFSSIFDTFVFIEKDDKLTYSALLKKINLNRPIKMESQARKTKIRVKYVEIDKKPVIPVLGNKNEICFDEEKSSVESDPKIKVEKIDEEIDNSELQLSEDKCLQSEPTLFVQSTEDKDETKLGQEE